MGLKTTDSKEVQENIYRDINMLALKNIKNDTLPYINNLPFPEDMNIVNGKHLGDINKIHLELKAASIGAKSLKWIYSADAAMAGLEIKPSEEPVLAVANISRNGKKETDIQNIYLMDQFTDESVKRIFEPEKIEALVLSEKNSKAKRKIKIIIQNMLKNISEYDSGINEAKTRELMRKNIKNNFSKNGPSLEDITETKNKLFNSYNSEQKTIFNFLNAYYTQQKSGMVFYDNLSPEEKQTKIKAFIKAVENLAKKDSPLLAQTLCESYFFADRTTHLGFTPERIITPEDKKQNISVLAPKAAELNREDRNIEIAARQKEVERLRSSSRQIKPPVRGH